MVALDSQLLPLLGLYAETHFKFFSLFPSFLFKNMPEIIFDCPRRIEPGHDLPILLLIHDSNRFPVQLDEVAVTISGVDFPPVLSHFSEFDRNELDHPLKKNYRTFIFLISREKIPDGEFFINAKATVTDKKGKGHIILNDNLPTSTKLPFLCTFSSERLPAALHCVYGDFHVHSSYSESHVEFGPPIEAISRLSAASGIHVINISDHSYDLACSSENYLIQDRHGDRWNYFYDESSRSFPTVVLRGEEISCLNSKGQVIHLCGTRLKEYIPGTLDGARKNTIYKKQLTLPQAADEIHRQGGLAFAAHPGSKKSLLQSIFLRRGKWEEVDCIDQLDAFQAYNSGYKQSWNRAFSLWLKMLARGRRIPLLAGNDAHGDFNRYRAIGTPFVSIVELPDRYFGAGKTGMYGNPDTVDKVIETVKKGQTFVTDGPYISINRLPTPDSYAVNSDGVSFSDNLYVHAMSTLEFGRLQRVTVYGFDSLSGSEKVIFTKSWGKPLYEVYETMEKSLIFNKQYIRVEIHSITEKGIIRKAFTSGCFNNQYNP